LCFSFQLLPPIFLKFFSFFLRRHFLRICDTLKLSLRTGESEYLSDLVVSNTHGPRSPPK
jgi:hypothetical protein